jgi:hypothetical protein
MKLTQNIEINENIITAKISAVELGNSVIDLDTEKNQLHNFTRTIEYATIDFSSGMKLSNGVPIVTSDPADDTDIEEVTIKNLINKKIALDENFAAELVIDIDKIPSAEYENNTVFNSPELLGQAYAVLFIEKIKTAVSEKLTEIRALANNIEQSTDVVL